MNGSIILRTTATIEILNAKTKKLDVRNARTFAIKNNSKLIIELTIIKKIKYASLSVSHVQIVKLN